MNMTQFDNARLDSMLEMFAECKNGGIIMREHLFRSEEPEDWRLAVAYLVRQGYLKEYEDRFEITFEGKAFFHNGGFAGKHRKERVEFYCTIIAAVASVLGLIISIVALCC